MWHMVASPNGITCHFVLWTVVLNFNDLNNATRCIAHYDGMHARRRSSSQLHSSNLHDTKRVYALQLPDLLNTSNL